MDKNKNIVLVVLLCLLLILNFTSLYHINLLRRRQDDLTWKLKSIEHDMNNLENNFRRPSYNNYESKENNFNEIMSPSDLSKYLNIGIDDVYRLIEDKKYNLPYVKINSEYRISKNAINEWLKTRVELNTDK